MTCHHIVQRALFLLSTTTFGLPVLAVPLSESELNLQRVSTTQYVAAHNTASPVLSSVGSNSCGDGAPDPGEECDDGNTVSGDGCSATCQLETKGGFDCTDAIPGTPDVNLVTDGSFEMSNVNNDWPIIEHSIFGSVLCNGGCFGGSLGSDEDGNIVSGAFVLVAGGSFSEPSTGAIEHAPIAIPPEAESLLFNWGIGTVGGDGAPCAGPDDGMRLLIDNVQVWSSLDDIDECVGVPLYQVIEISLTGFNDGGLHTIRFEGAASAIPPNVDLTNIFLDQIRIYVPAEDADPPIPSVCTAVVCGDGQFPQFSAAGTEECDDGNLLDGDGCSSTCSVEHPDFVCDAPLPPAASSNRILDGGFEQSLTAPAWTQTGTEFEPICSQLLCNNIARANTGAFYAWFGRSNDPGVQTLTQSLIIPQSAVSIDFSMRIGTCDSIDDSLTVEIDGSEIYRKDCLPDIGSYTPISVALGTFADDNMHTVTFRSVGVSTNGGRSNYYVDDIYLQDNVPLTGQAGVCTELVQSCTDPELFDAGIPSSWSVINLGDNPTEGWGMSNDGMCGAFNWSGGNADGNTTRGGASAACADSDAAGQSSFDNGDFQVEEMDTYLCSPSLNLQSIVEPSLSFLANYQAKRNGAFDDNQTPGDPSDDRDLDLLEVLVGVVSPNATTLPNYSQVAVINDHLDQSLQYSGAQRIDVDLSTYNLAPEVFVCFHYRGTFDWYAQIDNVTVRSDDCSGFNDADGDGIGDSIDNCTTVLNANQLDTDNDGFGNACDADFNNDCVVNALDLGILRTLYFQTGNQGDLNGDGITQVADLGIFRTLFFGTPGPSASASCTR